jgi:hypothetical protein
MLIWIFNKCLISICIEYLVWNLLIKSIHQILVQYLCHVKFKVLFFLQPISSANIIKCVVSDDANTSLVHRPNSFA